jgi:putative hydrolase of the HAD superfamily
VFVRSCGCHLAGFRGVFLPFFPASGFERNYYSKLKYFVNWDMGCPKRSPDEIFFVPQPISSCYQQENTSSQMMMSDPNLPVTTLLFDMDNTLCDLVGAQIAACDAVVHYLGREDGEELFAYFLGTTHGFESHENIREYLSARRIPVNGTFDAACRIYDTEKLRHIVPYPGVSDTLAMLHRSGYPMGIVTDAEKKDATRRLGKCGIHSLFDCIVTFDVVRKKKPSPEPFRYALRQMNVSPEEVLLVGDSPRRDIEPCRALGIRTAYARYGDRFSSGREAVFSDYVMDCIDQLPVILDGFGAPQSRVK